MDQQTASAGRVTLKAGSPRCAVTAGSSCTSAAVTFASTNICVRRPSSSKTRTPFDNRQIPAYYHAVRRKGDQLIPLEISILEAAVALHGRGTTAFHGFLLAKLIKTASDSRLLTAHGTLYRALHRLERAKLLEAFWEDPHKAARERRPRRRLYRLTSLSESVLRRARAQQGAGGNLRSLKEGLGTP